MNELASGCSSELEVAPMDAPQLNQLGALPHIH